MKLVQINCVYKYGSTGKIVEELHKGVSKIHNQSLVCYGRGKKILEPEVFKVSTEIEGIVHGVLSRLTGEDFSYSFFSTRRLIKFLDCEKPDVVHLHCLNGHFVNVYDLLDYLKKKKIKTVLTLHAEIMHTAGCEHAYDCNKWITGCYNCDKIRGIVTRRFRDDAQYCYNLMQNAFKGYNNLTVVGVSEWLTQRARKSSIFSGCNAEFKTVNNGINTHVFHEYNVEKLRQDYLENKYESIILHVTPNFNNPIKGGQYILELAKKNPKWKLVIVGYNGDGKNIPDNVLTIGHTDNQIELAKLYNIADVTVLASRRETYSMVCAESLCCGTPVAGFFAGAPETITLPQYSKFVEYGNINALNDAINSILNTDKKKVDCSITQKVYSSDTMVNNYLKIYNGGK